MKPWGVRFHPQGFIVGVGAPQSGSNGMLWFWKPDSPKAFHTIKLSHCGRGIDLTPDAAQLAVAQYDGLVRIYQMTAKSDS